MMAFSEFLDPEGSTHDCHVGKNTDHLGGADGLLYS